MAGWMHLCIMFYSLFCEPFYALLGLIYVLYVLYLDLFSCSHLTLSRADDDFSGPMDTNVRLRYNGEITWDAPAITKSSCVVDVSYFPFDSQECNLTFGSWTYNGNQVFTYVPAARSLRATSARLCIPYIHQPVKWFTSGAHIDTYLL